MPTFAYQAVDTAGKRLRGRAEAASPELLLRSLADRGVVVVDVTTADDAAGARGLGARFGRQQAVLEATRALAALLPAGMPLARALGVAATLTTGAVAEALEAVRRRVERGESVATALAAYPDLFPPLYVGVVRAGEKSGDLDAAFQRLAALADAQESLADPVARDEAARIRLRVREGAALHQAIAEGTLFPALLTQVVAVGEEAARLEEFLLKAADILDEKTERVLQRL